MPSLAKGLLSAFVISVLLAVFTRTFLVQAFRIPTASMEPGLLAGDYVLVNKFIYGAVRTAGRSTRALLPMRGVRRGDVVVFRYPLDVRLDFIKRCVALTGDTVRIEGRELTVNGVRVEERGYVEFSDAPAPAIAVSFGPYTVPPDRYLVLGDHRDRSRDSRSWGPIAGRHLKGRALVIYGSMHPKPVAGETGSWDKVSHRLAGWLQRWRWQRSFKLVR